MIVHCYCYYDGLLPKGIANVPVWVHTIMGKFVSRTDSKGYVRLDLITPMGGAWTWTIHAGGTSELEEQTQDVNQYFIMLNEATIKFYWKKPVETGEKATATRDIIEELEEKLRELLLPSDWYVWVLIGLAVLLGIAILMWAVRPWARMVK